MELNQEFIDSLKLDVIRILNRISEELDIPKVQVNATVGLIKDGNTVPFISRYRKEVTGSLDEVAVRDISHKLSLFENLEERRIEVIKAIFGQGKLDDELYKNIDKCQTVTELEDLYAPYKKKKKTRAMIAIERGLEPLAELMMTLSDKELETRAAEFVSEEKGVASVDDAIQGAMDIIAERVAQDMDNRKTIRDFLHKNATFIVKGTGNADTSVYKMYYDYTEALETIKPHRIMAINRGERENELEVKIEFEAEQSDAILQTRYRIFNSYHKLSISDGLKRLLMPSILREIRGTQWEDAEKHSIGTFSENLQNLLLQPPIKRTRVLGVDPGIRTGTKCAALDENGKYLGYFLMYQDKKEDSKKRIAEAVKKFDIELIAIGNGTGSHEVQEVIAESIVENALDIPFTVVSEDGASVYSASPEGTEEYPELDVTVRGAISIGHRLQDPLAEFVKIDPKSLGVGIYQHDVNPKMLSDSLDEVVESVVNRVGVNLNTASYSLLRYVSGLTLSVAKNIVEFRNSNGAFLNRDSLRKVTGMGPKSFEQAAGFLKIPESKDPLDNTWVHPENYAIAREVLDIVHSGKSFDKTAKSALKEKYGSGDTTLDDIYNELKKPNRDPREDFPLPILQKGVVKFEDLNPGMTVKGKVKNVVDFGAFIDIGIKESALLHISQLSDNYVRHPSEVIKVGDVVSCKIIEIDAVRKRIALSMKSDPSTAPRDAGPRPDKRDEGPRPAPRKDEPRAAAPKAREPMKNTASLRDLLSKMK